MGNVDRPRTSDPARDDAVPGLARCALLSDLAPGELARLADLLVPVTAGPGSVLLRAGTAADQFLLLTCGSVRVEPGDEPGRAVVVPEGSIVGEIGLLRGTVHRSTATALGNVRALSGDARAFEVLLGLPGVREHLVRQARQRIAAGSHPVPVALPDGTTVALRPVVPDDRRPVREGAARSSTPTLYRRFFRAGQPSERELRYLADADYVDHFAWVALDAAGVPVGEASYFRATTDREAAEVSFWLPDDLQGRGLGTVLMGALAVAGRRNGVQRFTAEVLVENAAMRRILRRAGVTWGRVERGVVDGVVAVPEPRAFGLGAPTVAALEALVDDVTLTGQDPPAASGPAH